MMRKIMYADIYRREARNPHSPMSAYRRAYPDLRTPTERDGVLRFDLPDRGLKGKAS